MTRERKIIFTVTNDLTYDQRMQRICQTLATNGFEVMLVGRKKVDSISLKSEIFQQKRLSCYFENGKLFYLEYNCRLFLFLLRQSPDAICAIDLDTILPVLGVAQIKNIPRVFDAHEYFQEVPEVVDRPFTRAVWERVANFAVPKFDLAYTVGESLAEIFTNKYSIPFSVIRNLTAVKTDRDATDIQDDAIEKMQHWSAENPVLFYQGALNEGRGLEAMIEAMPMITKGILVIAGEGDLSHDLRALVAKNYLRDRVFFLGYLTPTTLREITPMATLGINLLENRGLSYYYSLANKTFDYMYAGVPALHMDFPEYKRVMDQCQIGLLLPDLNLKTIADHVNKLLTDRDLYLSIKANCRIGSIQFTWQLEAKKLLRRWNDLF